MGYWCVWCNREIQCVDGLVVHDDVYHPADFVYDSDEVAVQ